MTTAAARLLSVRVQGFKSFAERTQVTFGPGISAIVGPNGSGKSNLADALRWALGEQGRALRSRRSEDVIWAGSEQRAAVGMADVQLTLDNADSLLPVDFGVVELGRRLYRSGENEYLLNRQRIRLRDLIDLLDAAHLAENAFLFIGQGMVDQALALRPEERRPLFEEVAGVRRHERRRRKAEEQLAESEANIARVEDILAELRPQVRRLAAQAEQQVTRASAGDDLVSALLAAGHARWHEAAARRGGAASTLVTARSAVDAATAELTALEEVAATAAEALVERARTSAEIRALADAARAELTAARLDEARIAAEMASIARDRDRLEAERSAAEAELVVQRRRLTEQEIERDAALDASLAAAERDLAAALAELAELDSGAASRDADAASVRRAAQAHATEAAAARRRVEAAERLAADQAARAAETEQREAEARTAHGRAETELGHATETERAAQAGRDAASVAWVRADAAATEAARQGAAAASALAAIRTRRLALEDSLDDHDGGGFGTRMRAKGVRRLDEGLIVEPGLRAAVDAALAGASRGYLSRRDRLGDHAGQRGLAIVVDGLDAVAPAASPGEPVAAFVRRVRALGGGLLADGVQRDASGAARSLLNRAAWVPDLGAAVSIQEHLPPGWVVVPRDGSAVVGEVLVRHGGPDPTLELRAELDEVLRIVRAAEREAASAAEAARLAEARASEARAALDAARAIESGATIARRHAEDIERRAARDLEAALREAAWHVAQHARLEDEARRARADAPAEAGLRDAPPAAGDRAAVQSWEARVAGLRARRGRAAGEVAAHDAARAAGERRRATAEAAAAFAEARLATSHEAFGALLVREAARGVERETMTAALAAASIREADARAAESALLDTDADDRQRLTAAEHALVGVRDRLRAAEESARGAEYRDLEARLGLESVRESMLVELAGLGDLGLGPLLALAPDGAPPPAAAAPVSPAWTGAASSEADEAAGEELTTARLAAGLDRVAATWESVPPSAEIPSPGRLAVLRACRLRTYR